MTQQKSMKSARPLRVGVAGLGAVGRQFVERIIAEEKAGKGFQLVAVCARRARPWVKQMVETSAVSFMNDPRVMAMDPNIDVVVELMGGMNPAYEVVSTALSEGKHVLTANPALLAAYGSTFQTVAGVYNDYLGYEAAAFGGMPMRQFLGGMTQPVQRATVVFGGGTNRVLERMSTLQESFEKALAAVQASMPVDPTGKEDYYRLCVLHSMMYGEWMRTNGQRALELHTWEAGDIALARRMGGELRIMGTLDGRHVQFQPMLVPEGHALTQYGDQDVLYMETNRGQMTLTSPSRSGANAVDSLMNDLTSLSQAPRAWTPKAKVRTQMPTAQQTYFVRLAAGTVMNVRGDSRWTILQEESNSQFGSGLVIATSMTQSQVEASFGAGCKVLPIWKPLGADVRALNTPLRLVG